jgi:hypothetical protein
VIAATLFIAGCGGNTSTDTGGAGGGGGSAAGTAGASGAGPGGTAGSGPGEDSGVDGSTRIVTPAKINKVSKIDLLFMIDNSSSMADKQFLLSMAVPDLVGRLVDPVCIDPMTGQQVGVRSSDGSCARGEPEFDPIKDIHIGIITSSLGGHGANGVCVDPDPTRALSHNDDHGHLVARDNMDMQVPTFMSQGFLNWNPTSMAGQTPDAITKPFASMVTGVGQHGCGYEASLESIYRFLMEPEPYQAVTVNAAQNPPVGIAVLSGIDQVLLQQRSDFLRPDSAVAVVMLTDENDCSIVDGGQGFYAIIPPSGVPATSVLSHGTTPCLTNPNDKCCYNCGQQTPAGCPDKSLDSECQAGPWTRDKDPEALRCWEQKRRYGYDFLYPVKRYVDGFQNNTVFNRSGQLVKNPLYDDLSPACRTTGQPCAPQRDKSIVFLVGAIGVPWQDIAVDPSDLTKGYMKTGDLTDKGVWQKIVGDPTASPPVRPTDPHMIESIAPRAGLAPPSSPPNADPVHGHEWLPAMAPGNPDSDLQYACIFPLAPPRVCIDALDCDCFVAPGGNASASQNPLCQNSMGQYSNTQTRGKAYPGIRELQVLQGLGDQAVVGSVCPSNTTNMVASDFGYRPIVSALMGRLRSPLRARCLPLQLPPRADGRIPCSIVEAFTPSSGATCVCNDRPGRVLASPSMLTPEVKAQGTCFCQIDQVSGANLEACQTQVVPPATTASGWCYVDPSQAGANRAAECSVVQSCPPTDRRIIRFVNPDSEPRAGGTAFLVCDEGVSPGSGTPMDPCP